MRVLKISEAGEVLILERKKMSNLEVRMSCLSALTSLGSANPLQFNARIFMGISSFRVIQVRVWFIGNSFNAVLVIQRSLRLIIRKLSDEDYNFVSSAESGLPYIFHIRLFWFADWIDTNICDCLIFHFAYLLFISWSYV